MTAALLRLVFGRLSAAERMEQGELAIVAHACTKLAHDGVLLSTTNKQQSIDGRVTGWPVMVLHTYR
jgi:hypothetical protein